MFSILKIEKDLFASSIYEIIQKETSNWLPEGLENVKSVVKKNKSRTHF